MELGIYHHLPFTEYIRIPAINISSLKVLGKSPMQYRYTQDHPKSGDSLRLGTVAHTAVLEPAKFLTDYTIWEKRTDAGAMSPRRGKDWDAFVAGAGDKTICTPDEHRLAMAMRDSVRSYAPALRYLREGEAEVTMVWDDPDTGARCKGRVDWLTNSKGCNVLVGLKTTKDCTARRFGTQAAQLGYHLQWAWYAAGFKALTGEYPRTVEIVVESTAPHEPRCYSIGADTLAAGDAEWQRLLPILLDCEAHDHWPPAVEAEEELTLPSWAFGNEDDLGDLNLDFGAVS